MLSKASSSKSDRNWSWSPERLKIIEDVEFQWRTPPEFPYFNSQMKIESDGAMTVYAGYIWDGATAVPTGKYLKDTAHLPVISLTSQPVPSEWYATLRHDVCYECMFELDFNGRSFPYSRSEIDKQFYIDLKTNKFRYSRLYYYGVRWFGGAYTQLGRLFKRTIGTIRDRFK
jgi:hypothetical protein